MARSLFINDQMVFEKRQAMKQAASKVPFSEMLTVKRTVAYSYGPEVLSCPTFSLGDEVMGRLEVRLRYIAARGQGKTLDALPNEDFFVEEAATDTVVDVGALMKARATRRLWSELIEFSGISNSSGMLELVKQRKKEVQEHDDWARIETALLEKWASGEGQRIVQQHIRNMMPDKDNGATAAGRCSGCAFTKL